MEQTKKLMILGAAYSQLPLYDTARKMGIRTVACSIPGDYPGFDAADEFSYTDLTDVRAVADACRKHRVDGIATCSLDLGMRAIGYACETLGLPGPGMLAARTAGSKYLMKEAFMKAGVRTARGKKAASEEELQSVIREMAFPVMVKAVDLMGGRGIFVCQTPEEAAYCFHESLRASRESFCIVEEYIPGPLFGVEGMVQNGRILFMMPDNTEVFQGETAIPIGHSVPLREYDERIDDIREQITRAVKAIGLDNCPFNADCILSEGKTWILEMTGRSGATGLSEIVSLRYGINYYEQILRLALGEDVSGAFAAEPFPGGILSHTLSADGEGTVRSIVCDVPSSEELQELSFNIGPGDRIRPFTNGRDRIGQVILRGSSLQRCEELLMDVKSRIQIMTEEEQQGGEYSCSVL